MTIHPFVKGDDTCRGGDLWLSIIFRASHLSREVGEGWYLKVLLTSTAVMPEAEIQLLYLGGRGVQQRTHKVLPALMPVQTYPRQCGVRGLL